LRLREPGGRQGPGGWFGRAGREDGPRADVPEAPANAGGGEPTWPGRAFPGSAEVLGEWSRRDRRSTHQPFELIIGTGLRKGEALALHWADVRLDQAVLFVRYTLSNISNTTPVMTAPKTKSSHAWVSLSTRVIGALEDQAR